MGASWGQPGGPRRAGGGERASGRRDSGRDGVRARRARVISTIERLCARHNGPGTRAESGPTTRSGDARCWLDRLHDDKPRRCSRGEIRGRVRDLPRSLTREGHRSRHSGRHGGRLHVVITDTRDDGRASLVAMGTPAGRISSEWRRFFLVFWRSRREGSPAANQRPRILPVRSGMIFHRCGPYESETS